MFLELYLVQAREKWKTRRSTYLLIKADGSDTKKTKKTEDNTEHIQCIESTKLTNRKQQRKDIWFDGKPQSPRIFSSRTIVTELKNSR